MKTIYLHIGRGKTGTTLLQSFLSQKRDELLRQGVHYVFADDRGKGFGHQQFAKSFIRNYPDIMERAIDPEAVRRRVHEEITQSDAQTIVLSSENFPVADEAGVHRYFSNLANIDRVNIILFVRSQDELAESEYNQVVKLKRVTCSFSEYLDHAFIDSDFMALASRWASVFGDASMTCRIFDGSRYNIVDQFLACIPEINAAYLSPYSPPNHNEKTNQSIGIKALAVARILNEVEIDDRLRFYGRVFDQLSGKDLPALLFSSEEASAYRARFAHSNRAFTERYFGQPRPDLGGRRYTDDERDQIRADIERFGLERFHGRAEP